MTTLDLELEIGRNLGAGYPVLARAGQEVATTRLPVTSVELDRQFAAVRSAVLASSTPVDPVVHDPAQSGDQRHMRELGTQLFDALLTGDVRELYAAIRRRAGEQGSPMRFVLRVHPAELTRLPWEFLFDPDRRNYLGLGLSLARYPEVLAPRQPLRTTAPLRILGMVARSGDRACADEQRQRLQEALGDLERAGLVQLGWADGHTPADLAEALGHGQWHGLHFFGSGQPDWSDEISGLLANHHTLRLVVLNCCAAGSGAVPEGFAGAAGALVRQGIPAVVAMHFEISPAALREFAHPLYYSVAKGVPVDIGVMRARRAIRLAKKDTLEWGTPVLYLRAPDGRIFDAAPLSDPVPSELVRSTPLEDQAGPADPAALYDEAMD
ncbi:MAG TPA: CHAT domain-containing protein, partial [Pseudonocardiaceae bacterium]|nr:CHAT domain-containing protein [Pseudonocardiaceae bacterium]